MTDESIFAAARIIPDPAARAAYLDRACGGDPALRREVDELLAADAASNLLDAPPDLATRAGVVAAEADTDDAAVPGERVGPYKLREKIGEGGMGEGGWPTSWNRSSGRWPSSSSSRAWTRGACWPGSRPSGRRSP